MRYLLMCGVVILFVFSLLGCASESERIAKQNILEAEAAISYAKSKGASTSSANIVKAEHYYKRAVDNYQKDPEADSLVSIMREESENKRKASLNALYARKEAESAMEMSPEKSTVTSDREDALQQEINSVKSTIIALQERLEQQQMEASAADAATSSQLKKQNEALQQEINRLNETLSALQGKKNEQVVIQQVIASNDPKALYETAFHLYHDLKYRKSIEMFNTFLKKYPSHHLSSNSQYWIGECYYAMAQYEKAGDAFESVLTNYTKSNKFADALLMLGKTYNKLNNYEKSKEYFMSTVEQYPQSRAAIVAKKILDAGAAGEIQ